MNRAGRNDYTAKDYINSVALRFGGQKLGGFNQGVDRSIARTKLKADIANWKKFIKNLPRKLWDKRSKKYKKQVRVMDTPLVLQICGVPNLPMNIKQGKVNQIRMVDHPEMTDDILEQLPGAMTNPIAVVKSSSRPNSIVMFLSLKDTNKVNIIVPIAIKYNKESIEVNLITSAYGKGNNRINTAWYKKEFKKQNHVLYINRKKAQSLVSLGVQFPLSKTGEISLFVDKSIKHEEDLVNARNYNPTMYQMAGERAKTAAQDKLEKAKAMEAEGKLSDDIYKETGWLKGKDGKWRFEIPDNFDDIHAEEYIKEGPATKWPLGRLYENNALYEAYPSLWNIPVLLSTEMPEDTNGATVFNHVGEAIKINYRNGEIEPEQLKKTLLHEIQHIIQRKEGFASGGSIEAVINQINNTVADLESQLLEGITDEWSDDIAVVKKAKELVKNHNDIELKLLIGEQKEVNKTLKKLTEIKAQIEELLPGKKAKDVFNIGITPARAGIS